MLNTTKAVHSSQMDRVALERLFFNVLCMYEFVSQVKLFYQPQLAAANIPIGKTAHSRFKIPVDHENGLSCNVGKQSGLGALLRQTSLIIQDEASINHRQNIEALDLLLLHDSTDLFGEKTIVFGSDFKQALHVLQHKIPAEAVDASLVSLMIWSHLKKIQFTLEHACKRGSAIL